MIKSPLIIFTFVFFIGINLPANAQFVNLQITVEPELSATVEQDLDFGTLLTNSGRTNISLGDVKMGVFSIRAFHTQNIYLSLEYPQHLINSDTKIEDRIPLELSISYNNSGENLPANSKVLPDNEGFLTIHERTAASVRNDHWKELYLYIHGMIEVGNIAHGVYTGDIILSVDYD